MLLKALISRYLGWCPGAEAVAAKIEDKKVGLSLAVMLIACSAFSSLYLIALKPVPGVAGLDIYTEIWTYYDAIAAGTLQSRLSTTFREESPIRYSEAVGKDVKIGIVIWSTRSDYLWLYGEYEILEGGERFESFNRPTIFPAVIHKYEPGVSYYPSVGGFGCTLSGLKFPGIIRLRLAYSVFDSSTTLVTNGTREIIVQVVEK